MRLGDNFLDVVVGNKTEFKVLVIEADQTKMKGEAFDQFMAILFLRLSNQSIYGNMQDEY